MNPMKNIRIEKVTLNFGSGKDQNHLEKGVILLEMISGKKAIKTVSTKRIPTWGVRPGLPVGCKVTVRGEDAKKLLKRLLGAKENRLIPKQFDQGGNISFGIPEYIDIPEAEYEPKIGIIGLEVMVTLERSGFRIKRRTYHNKKVPTKQLIQREEAMEFMKKEYNVKIGEEDE